MGDLDISVVKLTQQTLGKYVKKPPLTEKLLTKPPFRFLHDVFNAVSCSELLKPHTINTHMNVCMC